MRGLKFEFRSYGELLDEMRRVTKLPRWVHVGILAEIAHDVFGHPLKKIHEDSGMDSMHERGSSYTWMLQCVRGQRVYRKLTKEQIRRGASPEVCCRIQTHPSFNPRDVRGSWDRLAWRVRQQVQWETDMSVIASITNRYANGTLTQMMHKVTDLRLQQLDDVTTTMAKKVQAEKKRRHALKKKESAAA